MTSEKYGLVWEIDHCLAYASFNLLDEKILRSVSIGLISDQSVLKIFSLKVIKLMEYCIFYRKLKQNFPKIK